MEDQAIQRAAGAHRTDLGIIIVISKGERDMVFLAHNHLRVFTLKCPKNKPSQVIISKQFYAYEERQWDEVFRTYLAWKRKQSPQFKLPHHSGRRKDGASHPWRWHKTKFKEHEP